MANLDQFKAHVRTNDAIKEIQGTTGTFAVRFENRKGKKKGPTLLIESNGQGLVSLSALNQNLSMQIVRTDNGNGIAREWQQTQQHDREQHQQANQQQPNYSPSVVNR